MSKCTLYRCMWIGDLGYVVYRHNFGKSRSRVAVISNARFHKVAVFVCEIEAKDYCVYRNRLTDRYGSDALPKIADQ